MVLDMQTSNKTQTPQSTEPCTRVSLGVWINWDVDHVEQGHFKRVSLEVKRANGKTVEAVAFMANKEFLMEGLKPNKAYVSEILEGEDVVPPDYYAFLKSFGETQK